MVGWARFCFILRCTDIAQQQPVAGVAHVPERVERGSRHRRCSGLVWAGFLRALSARRRRFPKRGGARVLSFVLRWIFAREAVRHFELLWRETSRT